MNRSWPIFSLAVLGVAMVMACSSEKGMGPTGPQPGTIVFDLDGVTSAALPALGLPTLTINFFIDGKLAGTGNLAPGQESQPFPVAPGGHNVGATVANSGYTANWSNGTLYVTAGQPSRELLQC